MGELKWVQLAYMASRDAPAINQGLSTQFSFGVDDKTFKMKLSLFIVVHICIYFVFIKFVFITQLYPVRKRQLLGE